ncbi:MFS transporter [Allorhizocola rhizosphaerae]|uniref:MFS transporter n=1 Tax=Allorhizocola rhizosphaerae TaxID=1872709 RepID=UPI0013C2D966|nr:MFS transporter [Allorhizocola rhizosphaerae]
MIDCRPLRIPAFRRLWVASAVTAVGGSFSLIAVPAQLYALTGSSTAVGAASGVSMGSLILAALWSGTLADAMDRRWLLLAGHAGLGLAHVGLWLNGALGFGSVPAVLVLAAVQGLGFGTVLTVAGAAVPRLVPSALLVAANSLTSLTRHTGAVAGPLLAGVLIPLAGLDTLYLLDALALTGMLWAVGRLPAMLPAGPVERAGLGEGFRQVARHRVLVAVLAVDLAAMVFSLPFALYPELAAGVYGGPAGGGMELGLLYAAYPAGVIMVGLVSGTFSRARRHGALMASAAMAWGGCAVLLGLATDLWPALAALVVGGGVNFVLSTFRNAISQACTDDALRGRVQGALVVVVMGGPQLANLVHGLAGAAVGARVAIGAGGALTVVTVALLVRVVPELCRYDARSVREREGEPGGAKATRPAPNPQTLGAQAKPSRARRR